MSKKDGSKKKKVPKVSGKVNSVPAKSIAKAVKKEVMKLAESKSISLNFNNLQSNGLTYYSSAGWATFNIIPITPYSTYLNIAQGTGEADRIGNKIRTHKLMYRGVLFANSYNVTWNPTPNAHFVRMIVFSRKDTGNTLLTSVNGFFNNGNTTSSPQSNMFDLVAPYNKMLYNVKYVKTFKVGPAINTGSGNQTNQQNNANNDFNRAVAFDVDLTKYIPKVFVYNDGTNTPSNDTVFVMFFVVSSDGTTGASTVNPIQLQSTLYFEYKDI